MMRLAIPLALLAAACSAACSGGSGSFDEVAASMEGIYQLETHTENLQACEPGGDSLLDQDSDGYLVAKRVPILGLPNLTLLSCADPADCRDKIARHEQLEPYAADFSFGVQEPQPDGSLTGSGASTGFDENGTCTGGSVFTTTVVLDGAALTVTQRRTIADDYPADADGFCTTDLAREAAAGNSCSQLESLSATFVEEL